MQKQGAVQSTSNPNSEVILPVPVSDSKVSGAPVVKINDPVATARWEFNDRKKLLYALVGYDFGPDPESRLDEIRAYKKNEAKFLIDALKPQPTDRILDLGSGCGFVARAFAPLCERLFCVDISGEFLNFCKEELREFPNVEFQQMEFAQLGFLAGERINKGYSNAVFIHFNLFDIVLYFKQLFEVLEDGGLFVFGMSDTDCLDINTDRYFGIVLDKYRDCRREPTLMHWNSATAVCAAATKTGFTAKVLCRQNGSAMVLLEKPARAIPEAEGCAPVQEKTALFRQWRATMAGLTNAAQSLSGRFPKDREARFLLAEVLRGSGMDDLALAEYTALLEACPENERHRVQQGIEQSHADRDYFPPAFAKRLTTAEYAVGHNAAVWREYAKREIQRGREIVRTIRQVTPLRGRRVLDVGSGYGGMLISMAEQGADVVGVEIDTERAQMGRRRLEDLGAQGSVSRGGYLRGWNTRAVGSVRRRRLPGCAGTCVGPDAGDRLALRDVATEGRDLHSNSQQVWNRSADERPPLRAHRDYRAFARTSDRIFLSGDGGAGGALQRGLRARGEVLHGRVQAARREIATGGPLPKHGSRALVRAEDFRDVHAAGEGDSCRSSPRTAEAHPPPNDECCAFVRAGKPAHYCLGEKT